jgi:hypothetical protein
MSSLPFILVMFAGPAAGFPPPTAPDPAARLKPYDSLWADLAGEETPATRALLKLSAKPDDAVALFAAKLKPLKIEEKPLRALLADLGSDKEATWKAAYDTLEYFDPRLTIDLPTLMNDVTDQVARARMVALLSGDRSPEKVMELNAPVDLFMDGGRNGEAVYYNFLCKNRSWWAEHKVERINVGFRGNKRTYWTRAVRAIALLEHIGTPAAEAVLKDLATGHPDAQPTKAAKEALARMGKGK